MIDNQDTMAQLLEQSIVRQRALYGPEQADCRVLQQLQSLAQNDGKVGPSFEAMFASPSEYRPTLAWEAQHMLDVLAPATRRRLLEVIAENDPPTACRIYMRDPALSDEEDAILWAGFAPKMSTMRNAFETGRAKRAKTAG